MYQVVVLGGGDAEWVVCALGKENIAGAHCNHCCQLKKDFHLRCRELWTLASLAAMARTFCDKILPAAAGRKSNPTGYNGVKHPSMFCIPVHLWASPILRHELGLVKDWLTCVKKFCDSCIETLPAVEEATCEHLVILGDMLEDLLTEQDDLSPKETIKEYETHLKMAYKEIRKRNVRIPQEMTGMIIMVPGRVSPEEQQLIAKPTWEIESCKQQSAELQKKKKEQKK
jgi:hypothetical protein